MRWLILSLFGAALGAACGGATSTSRHEESKAGSSAGGTGSAGRAGGGYGDGLAVPDPGGAPATPTTAGQGGGFGPAPGAGIVPEALLGCRGPQDAGCATCYLPTDGGCTVRSGSGAIGYTSYGNRSGPCPANGARCAQCSYVDERDLSALGQHSECDCGVDPGIDPCFDEDGCGCYCSELSRLSQACPGFNN